MKTFRIVKNFMNLRDGSPDMVMYKVEQRHHFMWLWHWWKAPSFAADRLFSQPYEADKCVRDKYPNAVIHDCYSEPKVGG